MVKMFFHPADGTSRKVCVGVCASVDKNRHRQGGETISVTGREKEEHHQTDS